MPDRILNLSAYAFVALDRLAERRAALEQRAQACGLKGTVLLADPAWAAAERVIAREMLERAEEIVMCNALRGPLRAVKLPIDADST